MEEIKTEDNIEKKSYLETAIAIKQWMEDNQYEKEPSIKSKNSEEKRLGKSLKLIRKNLIKPYLKSTKESKKEKYREKYPEIETVIQIINDIEEIMEIKRTTLEADDNKVTVEDIDFNVKNKKQCDLANLIIKDLKTRKKIEEANNLKTEYENKLT